MKFQKSSGKNKMLSSQINFGKTHLFLLLFFISGSVFAQQELGRNRNRKVMHRVSFGPVISFYKNNIHHTINTKAKPGFNAAYKNEILVSRKTSVLAGLEYMSQGFVFHGYYSAPNHTYLFDESFSYMHEVRYQEIQLPLAIKIAFNRGKDHPYSSYFYFGPGFRYIAKTTTFIESDSTGNTMFDGTTDLTFENHVVYKNINAFFELGFGLQKNIKEKSSSLFLEFTYKYSISRLHYSGYHNSNNLNIKDGNLAITIGLRF